MSYSTFDYLKNDLCFDACRSNPKGLDYNGMDQITDLPVKIRDSLREHFDESGKMDAKAHADWIYEVRITRSKLNATKY